MNTFLKNEMDTKEPKIKFEMKDRNKTLAGLKILTAITCEDFFDVPRIPATVQERFNCRGPLYEIPYFDADSAYMDGKSYDLVVIYEISETETGAASSQCPLRIEFRASGPEKYYADVVWQSASGNKRMTLCGCKDGKTYSEIIGYKTATLKTLLNIRP